MRSIDCSYDKSVEVTYVYESLSQRHAFYGGRTNAIELHHAVELQKNCNTWMSAGV